MKLHRGINITSVAGYGLEGLPGLLMALAFVLLFLGIFLPRNWFLPIFLAAEAGAAVLYIRSAHHDEEESRRLSRELHGINR